MGTLAIGTRRATAADAAAISRVHDSSWTEAYRGVIPHGALARMVQRRGPSWWADAIRRSTHVIVIEAGGEIVGYATVGPNRIRALPHRGEVYEIYILPEYQGVGLGTRLFLAARSELLRRGLKGAVVWVLAANERAVSFYRNAGGMLVAEGSETFDKAKAAKYAFAWE
jgi:ribosomal protein S18 acetylase RimI-like enzyme